MVKNLKAQATVCWSFLGEAISAALAVLLLCLLLGTESLNRFVEQFVAVFLGLPALLIAFSFQLRSSIVGNIAGDFAGWLQHKESDLYYLTAALYTVWSGVFVFLLSPVLATTKPPFWGAVVLGLLGWSVVQTFNLSRTSLEVHSLKTTFEREKKTAELKGKETK